MNNNCETSIHEQNFRKDKFLDLDDKMRPSFTTLYSLDFYAQKAFVSMRNDINTQVTDRKLKLKILIDFKRVTSGTKTPVNFSAKWEKVVKFNKVPDNELGHNKKVSK